MEDGLERGGRGGGGVSKLIYRRTFRFKELMLAVFVHYIDAPDVMSWQTFATKP